MSDADFTDLLNINLVGPFLCTREVARVMIAQKGRSIINTSSMVGIYGGRNQTAYAASKFGVNGLTKSCAKELGAYGIRVNAVAPGVVGTDMVCGVHDRCDDGGDEVYYAARQNCGAEGACGSICVSCIR